MNIFNFERQWDLFVNKNPDFFEEMGTDTKARLKQAAQAFFETGRMFELEELQNKIRRITK